MPPTFGPAVLQLVAAVLILALACCLGVLPVDRGRPLDPWSVGAMGAGALLLALWALATGTRAWMLSREEAGGTVLVGPESVWALDLFTTLPLVIAVPAATGLLANALRTRSAPLGALAFGAFALGLLALRETDTWVTVDRARGTVSHRTGWLLARVRTLPISAVTATREERLVRRGASAWDVVLVTTDPSFPRTWRGFRTGEEAAAERQRWDIALGLVGASAP